MVERCRKRARSAWLTSMQCLWFVVFKCAQYFKPVWPVREDVLVLCWGLYKHDSRRESGIHCITGTLPSLATRKQNLEYVKTHTSKKQCLYNYSYIYNIYETWDVRERGTCGEQRKLRKNETTTQQKAVNFEASKCAVASRLGRWSCSRRCPSKVWFVSRVCFPALCLGVGGNDIEVFLPTPGMYKSVPYQK